MTGCDQFTGPPGSTGPEGGCARGQRGPGRGRAADAPLEVYGDSAYGSGEARAAYRDTDHDTVIKPGPLRRAVPGGFTLDDFTIDEGAGMVTCPAGHTRPASPARTVTGSVGADSRSGNDAPPPRRPVHDHRPK